MLYLVDSSIYIFRAWQTLPDSIESTQGEPANAVIGFADTLAKIIGEEQPTHMVCAFDQNLGKGARKAIYPAYKANRPPAPPDLALQFQRCFEVAKILGIPSFGSKLVEADDIIGSFAKLAQKRKKTVTIVSADKDLAQFIRPGDTYWNFGKKLKLSEKDICNQFNAAPCQIADLLAICGDKVDNIPGVPGVGMATAARLLKKWGNINTLLASTEKIADMKFRGAPRVSALINEHADTIRLARKLTGLIHDESLPSTLSELRLVRPEPQVIIEGLINTGFTEQRSESLAKRVSTK
jgi:5'-3' exonuclease